jgi:hypothetical protein
MQQALKKRKKKFSPNLKKAMRLHVAHQVRGSLVQYLQISQRLQQRTANKVTF